MRTTNLLLILSVLVLSGCGKEQYLQNCFFSMKMQSYIFQLDNNEFYSCGIERKARTSVDGCTHLSDRFLDYSPDGSLGLYLCPVGSSEINKKNPQFDPKEDGCLDIADTDHYFTLKNANQPLNCEFQY